MQTCRCVFFRGSQSGTEVVIRSILCFMSIPHITFEFYQIPNVWIVGALWSKAGPVGDYYLSPQGVERKQNKFLFSTMLDTSPMIDCICITFQKPLCISVGGYDKYEIKYSVERSIEIWVKRELTRIPSELLWARSQGSPLIAFDNKCS